MEDKNKSKEQLIIELFELRKRITELETQETERKWVEKPSTLLNAINRLFRDTMTCETEEEVGRTCLAVAEELTGSKLGFICKINQAGLFDTIAISDLGWKACIIPKTKAVLMLNNMEIRGIRGRAIKDERSMIFNEPASHSDWVGTPEGHPRVTCFMGVPLKHAGKTIGIIGLANKKSGYTLADQQDIENLAVAFVEALNHKRSEEAMRKSEDRLQLQIYRMPIGCILWNPEFRVVSWNPAAERIFGFTAEEAIEKHPYDLIVPKDVQPHVDTIWHRLLEGDSTAHSVNENITKDGRTIICEWSNTPLKKADGTVVGVLSMVQDITERKKADDALQAALRTAEDERLKSKLIIESIGEPLSIIDTDFRFVYQNKVHRDTFGEHIGQLCYKAMNNRDAICEGCQMAESFRDGNIHTKERVVPRGKGSPQYVVNTASPLRDSTGKIVAGVELIRDITDWRLAGEAIKLAHAELNQIFNTSADGMSVVDKEFNVLRVNNTFATLSGISKDEAEGKKCYEVFRSYVCHTPDCPLTQILGGEERVEMDVEKERNDGIRIPCIVTATPFRRSDGELIGIVKNFTDITERKKLEGQLLQAQKMEAIGQLAGGIAHDFNNILTAIIGYGTILQTEMSQDDPLKAYLTHILNSAERATKLIQTLLAFSRKQIISLKPLNLNVLITGVEKLLSRIIGEEVEPSIFLTDKDLTVMADSSQMEQVLMNLATNARDAMPEGGRLTIRTEYGELDNGFIRAHGYGKIGSYALISVKDTGQGMDEETKESLFAPFFTTKEVGKGTGLGLSMVYGIIKQHNGYIDVQSELGKGTTFKIYLPLTTSTVEDKKPEDLSILKRGTETILIAEDDTYVREFVKKILTEYGYKVIDAIDGEDAIRLLNAHRDKIQLIILDVIIPKKDGKEVYYEIKKVKPDTKVIFISGYASDILYKKGLIEEGLNFIPKPMSADELLIKVREILDKRDTK